MKKEALESGIEEALRDKEAAMAENAAHQAKCLQHEAEVSTGIHRVPPIAVVCMTKGSKEQEQAVRQSWWDAVLLFAAGGWRLHLHVLCGRLLLGV